MIFTAVNLWTPQLPAALAAISESQSQNTKHARKECHSALLLFKYLEKWPPFDPLEQVKIHHESVVNSDRLNF